MYELHEDEESIYSASTTCEDSPAKDDTLEFTFTSDSNDVLSEENVEDVDGVNDSRMSLVPRMFNPLTVTVIDLSSLELSKAYVLETGRLPRWLGKLQNLIELRAAKIELEVLDPWILQLRRLEALYLEHNHIGTWPYFLKKLPKLSIVRLDGNPCLEKLFDKSPTFRSLYFGLKPTHKTYKEIPSLIRGPEWPIAANLRTTNASKLSSLGFFCGGIYSLGYYQDFFEEDCVTPLEPTPLMSRLLSGSLSSKSKPSIDDGDTAIERNTDVSRMQYNVMQKRRSVSKQDMRRSYIIREVFTDIDVLLNRHRLRPPSSYRPHVLLLGHSNETFNQLLNMRADDPESLSSTEMQKFVSELVKEEEEYIRNLNTVIKEFYRSKVKSASIARSLRVVFAGFPVLHSIHQRLVLPGLQKLLQSMLTLSHYESSLRGVRIGRDQMRLMRKQAHDSTSHAVSMLCNSFRRIQLVFESYAKNLWRAEYLLDLQTASSRLYENKEFEEHVKSQMAKLGANSSSYASLSFDLSPTTALGNTIKFFNSTASIISPSESERDMFSSSVLKSSQPLNGWVEIQLARPFPIISRHPVDFIYLPLKRLIRYERFFTSFAHYSRQFDYLVRILHKMRRLAAADIQASRRVVRARVLSTKFRTITQCFEQYHWDAVLSVKSRSYLEPGMLEKNTNDVIDIDNKSKSFVKEVFSESRKRVLRMIYCGEDILICDELFEQLIAKVSKSALIAVSFATSDESTEVRIVLLEANETFIAEVKEFKATYSTSNNYRSEFLEACQCDHKRSH